MMENIENFENIQTDLKLSYYGEKYDRIFKEYSIQEFQKKFKKKREKKDITNNRINSLTEICNIYFKSINIKKDNEDLFTNNTTTNKTNPKHILAIKNKHNQSKFHLNKNSFFGNKKNDSISVDPGKYSPNYNSIFKNVPYTKIKNPLNTTLSLQRLRKKELEYEKNTSVMIKSIEREKKYKKLGKNTSLPLLKDSNLQKNDASDIKSSKGFTFDKYIVRKDPYNTNKNLSTIITYINNQKVKKLSFTNSFNMRIAKEENFYNTNSPTICTYNPKYQYFEKVKNLVTPFESPDLKKSKSYLLKKLITSYDMSVDYKTVRLESLYKN